jgi:hypothetical protein
MRMSSRRFSRRPPGTAQVRLWGMFPQDRRGHLTLMLDSSLPVTHLRQSSPTGRERPGWAFMWEDRARHLRRSRRKAPSSRHGTLSHSMDFRGTAGTCRAASWWAVVVLAGLTSCAVGQSLEGSGAGDAAPGAGTGSESGGGASSAVGGEGTGSNGVAGSGGEGAAGSNGSGGTGSNGGTGSGSKTSVGGSAASGAAETGGAMTAGGATGSTGGTTTTGGSTGAGGRANRGGQSGSGGTGNTGGTSSTGGIAGTGGSTATCNASSCTGCLIGLVGCCKSGGGCGCQDALRLLPCQ